MSNITANILLLDFSCFHSIEMQKISVLLTISDETVIDDLWVKYFKAVLKAASANCTISLSIFARKTVTFTSKSNLLMFFVHAANETESMCKRKFFSFAKVFHHHRRFHNIY